LIELCKIKNVRDFAEVYKYPYNEIRFWHSHPDFEKKMKGCWKGWLKKYTPGVMAKFHEKLLEEGDAQRMKVWLQAVEGEECVDEKNVNVSIGLEAIMKSMKEDGELTEKIVVEDTKVIENIEIKDK
jgi:hypothetical protein